MRVVSWRQQPHRVGIKGSSRKIKNVWGMRDQLKSHALHKGKWEFCEVTVDSEYMIPLLRKDLQPGTLQVSEIGGVPDRRQACRMLTDSELRFVTSLPTKWQKYVASTLPKAGWYNSTRQGPSPE
jgi:hypothetical protein